jgi:hypothetical protein
LRITAISSFEFCRKTAGAVAGVVGIEGGAISGVIHLESSGLVRRTADYVMKSIITWKSDSSQPAAGDGGLFVRRSVSSFEVGVRDRVGDFIMGLTGPF